MDIQKLISHLHAMEKLKTQLQAKVGAQLENDPTIVLEFVARVQQRCYDLHFLLKDFSVSVPIFILIFQSN